MLPRHKGIILLTENILNVTWWLVVSTPQGVGISEGGWVGIIPFVGMELPQ
jgi:hypothetical protein